MTKIRKATSELEKIPGMSKFLSGSARGLRGVAGVIGGYVGAAIEGAVELGFYEHARRKGYTHEQAKEETFFAKMLDPERQTGIFEGAEPLLEKELVGTRWDPSGKINLTAEYVDAQKEFEKELSKYYNLQGQLNAMESDRARGLVKTDEINAITKAMEDQANIVERVGIKLKPGTPAYESYMRAKEKQDHEQGMRGFERWGDTLAYKKSKERDRRKEFLDYQGAKRRYRRDEPYAFRDKTALDIVELGPEFWKEYGLADEKGIKEKWKQIYDMGGIDLLDRIGIAGGVSKMAGGGIVGIRKPNAIAPTGGPQSGGLPSLYNNVRKH